MAETETFEIRYKIDQALAALDQARKSAAATDRAIEELKDSYQRGAITGREYAQQVDQLNERLASQQGEARRLQREVEKLEKSHERATRAAENAATRQQNAAERTARAAEDAAARQRRAADRASAAAAGPVGGRAAGGLLTLGRTLDDAQQFELGAAQGLRAVSNNLVEIHPLLGLVAVAVGLVVTHWQQLAALLGDDSAFDEGYSSIEGLTARVKELREELEQAPRGGVLAALRGADQALARMTAVEKAGKDLDAAAERTPDRKANEELVTQAITEAGGADVVAERLGRADVEGQGATAFLGPEKLAEYRDLLRQRAQLEAQFARDPDKPGARKAFAETEAALKDQIQGLEEQARAAAAEKARTRTGAGVLSDLGREQLAARVREIDPDLAAKLTGAKPTDAEFDEQFEAGIEQRKKDAAKRRAVAAKDTEEYLAADQAESDRRLAERKRRREEQAGFEIEGRKYVEKFNREQGEALLKAALEAPALKKQELERKTAEATGRFPGLDELIGEQLKAAARFGGLPGLAEGQERTFNKIKATVGEDVALGLINQGGAAAQEALVRDALAPEKRRASEVIDAASFANAIQSGVGGQQDTPRKHLLEAVKTNQLLTRLLNRPPGRQGLILGR